MQISKESVPKAHMSLEALASSVIISRRIKGQFLSEHLSGANCGKDFAAASCQVRMDFQAHPKSCFGPN